MDKLFSVKDKVAVITGGMGQLGMCYVHALVKGGAKVAVFDLVNKPKIDEEWFRVEHQSGNLSTHKINCSGPSYGIVDVLP